MTRLHSLCRTALSIFGFILINYARCTPLLQERGRSMHPVAISGSSMNLSFSISLSHESGLVTSEGVLRKTVLIKQLHFALARMNITIETANLTEQGGGSSSDDVASSKAKPNAAVDDMPPSRAKSNDSSQMTTRPTPAKPADTTKSTKPDNTSTPSKPDDSPTPAKPDSSTNTAKPNNASTTAKPDDVSTPAPSGPQPTPSNSSGNDNSPNNITSAGNTTAEPEPPSTKANPQDVSTNNTAVNDTTSDSGPPSHKMKPEKPAVDPDVTLKKPNGTGGHSPSSSSKTSKSDSDTAGDSGRIKSRGYHWTSTPTSFEWEVTPDTVEPLPVTSRQAPGEGFLVSDPSGSQQQDMPQTLQSGPTMQQTQVVPQVATTQAPAVQTFDPNQLPPNLTPQPQTTVMMPAQNQTVPVFQNTTNQVRPQQRPTFVQTPVNQTVGVASTNLTTSTTPMVTTQQPTFVTNNTTPTQVVNQTVATPTNQTTVSPAPAMNQVMVPPVPATNQTTVMPVQATNQTTVMPAPTTNQTTVPTNQTTVSPAKAMNQVMVPPVPATNQTTVMPVQATNQTTVMPAPTTNQTTVPTNQTTAPAPPAQQTSAGVMLSVPRDGNFWSSRITVGGVQLDAIIDTASALTIVDGSMYQPSSAARDTGQQFSISFNDGSLSTGDVYTDTVSVAGQTIQGATVCRDSRAFDIDNAAQNGLHALVGLQRPGFAGQLTGLLDSAIGSLRYGCYALTLQRGGGQLLIGDVPSYYNSMSFTQAIDNPAGHWKVATNINNYQILGGAVLDSATAAIMTDLGTAMALFNSYNMSTETIGGMTVGRYYCTSPPALTVTVGTLDVKMDPRTLRLGRAADNPQVCYWALVGVPSNGARLSVGAILGAAFLKNVNTLFDFSASPHRVGVMSR